MGKLLAGSSVTAVTRLLRPGDVICVVLPLCSLLLWSLSLNHVDVHFMNDLGLISALPPSFTVALILLLVSFCLALQQPQRRGAILLFHIVCLIVILYGTQNLIEEAPRYSVVYRHAGYTEFIMRTGTVDPRLDAYFSWPGFFALSALLTRLVGYQDILSFAGWAPVFNNLIYYGPLYLLFSALTTDKRIITLGLVFFYLTNWIGQDYYSPQGLNFFMYLVIIAVLLKWFILASPLEKKRTFERFAPPIRKFLGWLTAPGSRIEAISPQFRAGLLVSIIAIYAFMVFTHPLSPFFVVVCVSTLVICRRITPWWLPLVMTIIVGAWLAFMTRTYLAGHASDVFGGFGQIESNIVQTTVSHVGGDRQHTFVIQLRAITTILIWSLACAGGIYRLRHGYRDSNCVLLGIAPFSLLLVQPYGGEMLLRVYLFTLPFMVFFVAALFYITPGHGKTWRTTCALVLTCLVLLGSFFFTRYGNERMDYKTYAELDGLHHLYTIAHPGSLLIEAWDGGAWRSQDYERYSYYSLASTLPDAVATANVHSIVEFIEDNKKANADAYIFFTRSHEAAVNSSDDLPPDALNRLEKSLLASGQFKIIYSNPDAQIILFTQKAGVQKVTMPKMEIQKEKEGSR